MAVISIMYQSVIGVRFMTHFTSAWTAFTSEWATLTCQMIEEHTHRLHTLTSTNTHAFAF